MYALPVAISNACVGALDLFRGPPGPLTGADLAGALIAADLVRLALLDLITEAPADRTSSPNGGPEDAEEGPAGLERVEVYQATGMIMVQLGIGPTEALLRLRAHAFARGRTAAELAWQVVRREHRFEESRTPERGQDAEGDA